MPGGTNQFAHNHIGHIVAEAFDNGPNNNERDELRNKERNEIDSRRYWADASDTLKPERKEEYILGLSAS